MGRSLFVLVGVVAVNLTKLASSTSIAEKGEEKLCRGFFVRKSLDFEEQRDGRSLRLGDTPHFLQDGITVTGQSFYSGAFGGGNDMTVIDGGNGEGNVIAVQHDKLNNQLVASPYGGDVRFQFEEPVFRIRKIHFLDIKDSKKSYIMAVDKNGVLIPDSKVFIPSGEKGRTVTIKLDDFYHIRLLSIKLRTAAAIARIEYTLCVGK